jgi:hypothetical protein
MRFEDVDFTLLIDQMWGSEANLLSFLDSEVPNLCSRICGPDAPVPTVKVTYPPVQGETEVGITMELAFPGVAYRAELDGAPAKMSIPALIAGNKARLPQFIALALIKHWEALGAIGEEVFEVPEAANIIIRESCRGMSVENFMESHSPQFIAKAAKVARDLEIPLGQFLFPKLSLTVYMPRPEEGTAGTST